MGSRKPVAVVCSLPAVVLVACAGRAARAQAQSADAGSESPSPATRSDLTPPELRSRAEAEYPPEALRDRIEGTVGLEIVVDETGAVKDARVISPAGHGFDEAALKVVRKFAFAPATKHGVPIASTVQLSYEFHLPPAPPTASPPAASPPPPSPPAPPSPGQATLVLAQRPQVPIGSPPERDAASQASTGRDELGLMPRRKTYDLLGVVPGLFTMRNAGGGKAQQEFARGFLLDHGTDMAFFADDVPINEVSHAHGQGYSDFNFMIPETVERIDSTKGPYAADVGDFATAGSVRFRLADHLDESLSSLELAPSIGLARLVVVQSPDLGDRWRMATAAQVFREDGPFIHPEDYEGINGYVKATRVLDERSELSLTAMAYSGSWNMSGLLPARAVCGEGDGTPVPAAYAGSRCIDRFDSLDPTQGGGAQRFMVGAQYRRQFDPQWDLKAGVYTLHSNLQLFPNDGIAAPFQPDGIEYGSQIEQDDTRQQSGVDVALTHRSMVGGMPLRTTIGLQFRDDAIESQLHRTQGRRRLDGVSPDIPGPISDDHIDEMETGLYVEEEVRPAKWLRFVLGLRGDRIDAAVNNESQTAINQVSGYDGQAQLSPKATAVITPVERWDLYANYGRGFHSNDARTLAYGAATTLIAAATGYEVGTTVRPLRGLSLSTDVFLIDLTSELTIDGDTASTSPAGPTRRYGIEMTGHYELAGRLYANAAFTATHGRYTDAADVAAGTVYLADAPIRTFTAGVGGRQRVGQVTLTAGADLRSIADRFGDPGPHPLIETGFTVVDARVAARWRQLELGADLFNVADAVYRGGQTEVASRLPGEGPNPPTGISFTPGLPRTLMGRASVFW
jgi:TonB family protein